MASGNKIQCCFLLLVFLCLLGFMEAIRKAPLPPLLLDSRQDAANGRGTAKQSAEVAESQTVVMEQADMEEVRILFSEGNVMASDTVDYSSPGSNRVHDPRNGRHHTGENGNGN